MLFDILKKFATWDFTNEWYRFNRHVVLAMRNNISEIHRVGISNDLIWAYGATVKCHFRMELRSLWNGGGKADSKSINISSTTINAFFIFISCAFPRNRRRSQYRPFLWQYIMNLLWLCVFLSLSVCRSVHGMCMKFATKWVPWQQRDPTISSAHFGSRPKNVLSNHFANESRK